MMQGLPFALVVCACLQLFPLSLSSNIFGCLPATTWDTTGNVDRLTTEERITTIKNLGIPYIREGFSDLAYNYNFHNHSWIKPQAWQTYQDYVNAGLRVSVNFGWQGGPGSSFPVGIDLTNFITALNDTLNALKTLNSSTRMPIHVVIENEEANMSYFNASVNREHYLDELAASITVVHAHGLRVTNAGLDETPLNLYVWHYYYSALGNHSRALAFSNRALLPSFFSNYPILAPKYQDQLNYMIVLINGTHGHPGYIDLDLDYINVHMYRTPGNLTQELEVLQEGVDVLKALTNKSVMTNELGARVKEFGDPLPAGSVTQILQFTQHVLEMPFIIWYSGPDALAKAPTPVPLNTLNGTLTPEGIEFRDYVKANKKNPS